MHRKIDFYQSRSRLTCQSASKVLQGAYVTIVCTPVTDEAQADEAGKRQWSLEIGT